MFFFLSKRLPFGFRLGTAFTGSDIRRALHPSQSGARSPAFVYVIQARGQNHVKVGISADPNARLRNLQTASPYPLTLSYAAAVKSNDASAIEADAKYRLGHYQLEGEWFSVSPEMAVAAISAASFSLQDPIVSVPPDQVARLAEMADASPDPAKAWFRSVAKIILWTIGGLLILLCVIIARA